LVPEFENSVLICLFSVQVITANEALAKDSNVDVLEPPKMTDTK
jgi:hypothetical protein